MAMMTGRVAARRSRRRRGTREQRFLQVWLRFPDPPLEELADHAEGEARLQLGSSSAQQVVARSGRPFTSSAQQRGLADPGPTLDDKDAASPDDRLDRGELALTLQEVHCGTTVKTPETLRPHLLHRHASTVGEAGRGQFSGPGGEKIRVPTLWRAPGPWPV